MTSDVYTRQRDFVETQLAAWHPQCEDTMKSLPRAKE